jgi:hypothetical protein
MSQLDRITRINALLSARRVVPRTLLLEELEVSPATLKRDIAFLRDTMNTPIVWDRELDGYRLDRSQTTGAQLEVPNMWFSDKEIHAILTMQHLLANLGPGGLLAPHVEPLMTRLNAMLSAAEDPTEEIRRRVLIVGVGQRSINGSFREHRSGPAATSALAYPLLCPRTRRGERAGDFAATPRPLPGELVSGRLVPPAGRSAQFCDRTA